VEATSGILFSRDVAGWDGFNGSNSEPMPDEVRTVLDASTTLWSTYDLDVASGLSGSGFMTHVACKKPGVCAGN
jgi:hypothetical protein